MAKKRPSLGSGMAEGAAKKLENRKRDMDRRLAEILGDGPTPDRTKPVRGKYK